MSSKFLQKSSTSGCMVICAHNFSPSSSRLFSPPLPPKPSAQEDLLAALLTCDVIVYDVVEDQTQVEEASWAVQGERGEREEERKREERKREERKRVGYLSHRRCTCTSLASFISRQRLFFAFLPVVLVSMFRLFQAMESWMEQG